MPTSLALILVLQAPAAAHAAAPVADPWQAVQTPPRGVGMLAAGGALTFTGTVLSVVAGAAFAARGCRYCLEGVEGAYILPVGVVALAVGIPLLGVGVYRFRVWREWEDRRRLTLRPQLGRSHGAWNLGLTLRF